MYSAYIIFKKKTYIYICQRCRNALKFCHKIGNFFFIYIKFSLIFVLGRTMKLYQRKKKLIVSCKTVQLFEKLTKNILKNLICFFYKFWDICFLNTLISQGKFKYVKTNPKNQVYGRQSISRPKRIVAPIPKKSC